MFIFKTAKIKIRVEAGKTDNQRIMELLVFFYMNLFFTSIMIKVDRSLNSLQIATHLTLFDQNMIKNIINISSIPKNRDFRMMNKHN